MSLPAWVIPSPGLTEVVGPAGPGRPAAPARRAGRPRDAGLPARVLATAVDVYAERGWTGFNFEAVAKAAGVGRAALYRRWADRSALLIDAMLTSAEQIHDVDLGSLQAELLVVLSDYVTANTGNRGRAGQRIFVDRHAIPGALEAVYADLMGRREAVVSAAVARAAARCGRPSLIEDRLTLSLLLGGALFWQLDAESGTPLDATAVVGAVSQMTGLS
jgi:AcrR family transcriptional regulator